MPGELKVLRYIAFAFLSIPFLSFLMFRAGPDHTFLENLQIGFLSFIVLTPCFVGFGGIIYLFDSRFRWHGLFVLLSSLFFLVFLVVTLRNFIPSLHIAKASTRPVNASLMLKFRGDNHKLYRCFPDELQSLFDSADEECISLSFIGFD